MNTKAQALANVASSIAARSAVRFLQVHNLEANSGKLADCLSSSVKAALPEALKDALVALAFPGMDRIAETTFAASMAIAGIQAAKDATKGAA